MAMKFLLIDEIAFEASILIVNFNKSSRTELEQAKALDGIWKKIHVNHRHPTHCHRFVGRAVFHTQSRTWIFISWGREKKSKSFHCSPLNVMKAQLPWIIAQIKQKTRTFAYSIKLVFPPIAPTTKMLFVPADFCRYNRMKTTNSQVLTNSVFLSTSRDLMKTWTFHYQCHNITVIHLPATYAITT